MKLTAQFQLLSKTETRDKCFQQGVAKTSAETYEPLVTVAQVTRSLPTSIYVAASHQKFRRRKSKNITI